MIHPQPKIAVLLSTYNGEQFIAAQLDSVLQQQHCSVLLVIRDDGSSDSTVDILKRYQSRHPQQVLIIQDQAGNLGAAASFGRLLGFVLGRLQELQLTDAALAFCDQDDVWLPEKLHRSLLLLGQPGPGSGPVLVHTDLSVVDSALKPISPSLSEFQGLQSHRGNFGRALVANSVTGCATVFNLELAQLAFPFPKEIVMHDWWLGLVARAMGKVVHVGEPLVLYRQHERNALGARPQGSPQRSATGISISSGPGRLLADTAAQARIFRERYRQHLSWYQSLVCGLAGLMSIRIPLLQKLLYRLLREM